MICSNCGKVLDEESVFCYYCGKAIEAEEPLKRRSRKKSFIVAISTSLGVIILATIGIVVGNQVIKQKAFEELTHFFEKGRYTQGISLYKDKLQGSKKYQKEVEVLTTEAVEKIVEDYNQEDVDYDESIEQIEDLSKLGLCKSKIEEAEELIEQLQISKKAYEEAEKLFKYGDYKQAAEQYKKIVNADIHYKKAQVNAKKALEAYKKARIAEVETLSLWQEQIEAYNELLAEYKEDEQIISAQTKCIEKIINQSIYEDSLRDESGKVYQLYVYSESMERVVASYDNWTVWAGASEGDVLYTGEFSIMYKPVDGEGVKFYNLGYRTLNMSNGLLRKIENQFKQEDDFLLVGTVEASAGSSLEMLAVRQGEMQLTPFTYTTGNTYDTGFSWNALDPYFKQVGDAIYQTADYDNAETGCFYVYDWEYHKDSATFAIKGEAKQMTREAFFAQY